jgi:hypothetical protein
MEQFPLNGSPAYRDVIRDCCAARMNPCACLVVDRGAGLLSVVWESHGQTSSRMLRTNTLSLIEIDQRHASGSCCQPFRRADSMVVAFGSTAGALWGVGHPKLSVGTLAATPSIFCRCVQLGPDGFQKLVALPFLVQGCVMLSFQLSAGVWAW